MPRKPKKPCAYPGCPNLTEGRYCPEHQTKVNSEYEKYGRDPGTKKRYGRAWKRIRDNNATAGTRAFLERLMFPIDTYLVDENGNRLNVEHKPVKTAVIYEMNCPEDFMDQVNYKTLLGDIEHELERLFGYCEILYVNNTYQFNDYSRYDINMFPEEMKRQHRDQHFPVDLQRAYELGKRLAEKALK